MPVEVIPLLNLLIVFAIFVLVFGLVFLISRFTTLITTIYFYFFMGSVLLFVASFEIGQNYLNFYDGMGAAFDSGISIVTLPFLMMHTLTVGAIQGIASLLMEDPNIISNYLLGDMPTLYLVIFQGVIFLLCLLLFRKKKKKNLDNSTYRE